MRTNKAAGQTPCGRSSQISMFENAGLLASARREALAAVDGTVVLGNKGHARRAAALGANGLVHLTRAIAGATAGLAGIAAFLAAQRLVLEALFRIELLLAGSKHKFLAAILANQRLVFVHWNFPPLN